MLQESKGRDFSVLCLVSGGTGHASMKASAAASSPAAQEAAGAGPGVNGVAVVARERQPTFPYGKVCSHWGTGTDLCVGMLCSCVF